MQAGPEISSGDVRISANVGPLPSASLDDSVRGARHAGRDGSVDLG